MSGNIILIMIAGLFGLSFAGLGMIVLRAIYSGAETYSGEHAETTARQFEDVFVFIPPRRIAEAGWACAAAAFILAFLFLGEITSAQGMLVGLIAGGIAAALALQGPRQLLNILKKRRLARFNAQLVDTLMSMSNALKAGFSITQAFESVVREGNDPIAQEFDVFLQQTRVGVSFEEALEHLDRRVGSEDLSLVVKSIDTARKTGGNLTEILESISSTIRERLRIENRVKTLTAQGRLQGIVVGSMPVIIGILLVVVDPQMMLPFLRSPAGMISMAIVALLLLAGGLVIRKIIKIDI
ncbi:MAG: type II secretion system F family protein [Verrucomicrobiota bacterium]